MVWFFENGAGKNVSLWDIQGADNSYEFGF